MPTGTPIPPLPTATVQPTATRTPTPQPFEVGKAIAEILKDPEEAGEALAEMAEESPEAFVAAIAAAAAQDLEAAGGALAAAARENSEAVGAALAAMASANEAAAGALIASAAESDADATGRAVAVAAAVDAQATGLAIAAAAGQNAEATGRAIAVAAAADAQAMGVAIAAAARQDAQATGVAIAAAARQDAQAMGVAIAAAAASDAQATGVAIAAAAASDAQATGNAVAAAAAEDAVSTGNAVAEAARTDPVATGSAVAQAAQVNAEATGNALANAAVRDPVATGNAVAEAAVSDPESTGTALTSSVKNNAEATGNAVIAAAGRNAASTGAALAAGPAKDPEALAQVGVFIPVEPWVPETEPPLGDDPNSAGFWEDVGSPAPIDNILGKYTRSIPDAKVNVSDIPMGTLAGMTPLPDGRVVNSFLSLTTDGFLEGDFVAAHVTLFVEKSWLSANNIHEWSLQFTRFDEPSAQWRPVTAKRVREDETRVFFSVVVPGFSQWTITGSEDVPEVQFLIENLTIGPRNPKAGDEVAIQVDVTNVSNQELELNLALWLNDQIDSMRRDVFQPGVKRPIAFFIHPKAGEFEIRIDRLRSTMSVAPGEFVPTPVPPVVVVTPGERGAGVTVGIVVGFLAAVFVAGAAAALFLGRSGTTPEGSDGGPEPTPGNADAEQPVAGEPEGTENAEAAPDAGGGESAPEDEAPRQ